MTDEVARLKAHHLEDLRPIVKALNNLADELKNLQRQWEAEENPEEEEPGKEFGE